MKTGLNWSFMVLVGALVLLLAGAAGAQEAGWQAEYYANPSLAGAPTFTRVDGDINFSWGTGSPGGGVPADNFSVRWTRSIWFDGGTYLLRYWSDDGLRVWVGDELVVDAWYNQQAAFTTRDVVIQQGNHQVKVEYFEQGGNAEIYLDWLNLGGGQGWLAEYYNNQDLTGGPAVYRVDSAIDFAWAYGAPDPNLPADHFSVRWTRTVGLPAGTYRFFTSTDDGVRLWVDNQLLIDKWQHLQLPNTQSGDIVLGAGNHQVKVEYFEDGGEAHAHVWWNALTQSFGGWKGEYYDNRNLTGGPTLIRDDAEISFDWGTAGPVSWMPNDNFSIRWTRKTSFQPGYYRFSVRSDDGVRVWLDGGLVIDKWQAMNNELHYVDGIYLSGTHQLQVEYYEAAGFAKVAFWVGAGGDPGAPSSPAGMVRGPWQAEYYDNESMSGVPVLTRQDATIEFDWWFDSPAPAVPAEYFSVRWTATLNFAAGRYQFTTHTDDGVNLYLDGQLIIHTWWPMRGYRYATVDLAAGPHTIVMEYYERTEAALAQLDWDWLGEGGNVETPH